MEKRLFILLILSSLFILYGFSVTIDSPGSNAVLTGTNNIEITLSFSSDINGNASAVYFYYKNLSEESFLLYANTSTNFTKYTFSFNASNFEDTLDGYLNVTVSNYTPSYQNVSAIIPVKLNNNAPVYTIIPNLTWPEDTTNNTLNISMYFSDTEKRNKFTYTSSSADSMEISINSYTGIVTIKPDKNFSGVSSVRFTASDGTLSNTSNEVLLNVTNINDPPTFNGPITNRTWIRNANMIIKLNEHFEDIDKDKLTYAYQSALGHVTVSMDPDGIATLIPEKDFIGKDNIIFTASDGTLSTSSNNVDLELITDTNNQAPEITSSTPTENSISINKGESTTFSITIFDPNKDTLTINWYVNDVLTTSNTDSYTFAPQDIGSYVIKVEASDGVLTASDSWNVDVLGATEQPAAESLCGNGMVDSNEDCENCNLDVICKEDESCVNKVCTAIKKESNFPLIIGLLTLILIITVVIVVLYQRRKKKEIFGQQKELIVTSDKKTNMAGKTEKFSEKPPADIIDFYFTKKEEKVDYLKGNNKGFTKTDLVLLRNYIKMALDKNMPHEKIKRNLISKGWNAEQVEMVLKETR